MKNKIILCLFIFLSLLLITGCNSKNDDIEKNNETYDSGENMNNDEFNTKINIELDGNNYILNLEDNETTRELYNYLPIENTFSELNGNEKYLYLDYNLPTNSSNPDKINKGDVYLYGDNCLVIFYKSFNTNYSYTKIGHIDNLEDLNNTSVNIKISK